MKKTAQNLINELVERRLWPIALVLALALVAVPVLLRSDAPADSGADPAATAALAGSHDGTTSLATTTAVAQSGTGRGLLGLPKNNPFVQHVHAASTTVAHAGPGPDTAGPSTAASGGGSGADSGGASAASTGDSGTGGGGSAGGSSGSAGTPQATYPTATVTLRFGRVDRARKARHIERLSPLPNPDNPVLVYLGVMKGTKTGVFLLSSDTKAEGDGVCKPSPRNCQTVWVKQGQTEFFDVTSSSGAVTQYELDFEKVAYRRIGSKAAANNAFLRVSKASKRQAKQRLKTQDQELESDDPAFEDVRWSTALRTAYAVPAPKHRARKHGDAPLVPAEVLSPAASP